MSLSTGMQSCSHDVTRASGGPGTAWCTAHDSNKRNGTLSVYQQVHVLLNRTEQAALLAPSRKLYSNISAALNKRSTTLMPSRPTITTHSFTA